jgi:hypothetical protein
MHLPRANYPAIKTAYCEAHDLERVAPAPPPDSPPLTIGDRCQLNSGSATLMVVDVEPTFTVAWMTPCGVSEYEIDRAAVRRSP